MAKRLKMYKMQADSPERKQENAIIILSAVTLALSLVRLVLEVKLADNYYKNT